MSIINQYLCASLFGNTGIGACSLIPKEIKGMFIVPRNFVITQANADNLQSFLEDAATADLATQRIFPVHNFVGITDDSEEPVRETLGYGGNATLRQGNYSWTMRFLDGGLCLLTQLQRFNQQPIAVLFYDADGVIYGRRTAGGLAGIPVIDFNANKWTPSDGSVLAGFTITVEFDSRYLNQELAFLKDDTVDLTDISGLQPVHLQAVSATAGSVTVQALAGCGGENLYDLYSTQLAAPALWVAIGTNGTVQTIDAVVAVPGSKAFTLSFEPVRTVPTNLNLASVSELDTAGVSGFEGQQTTVPLTLP